MRSGAIISLASLAAAALTIGSASWALDTTIGGRRIDLDGSFELRPAFIVDKDTAPDNVEETLRLHAAAQALDWLSVNFGIVGINGGPTSKATKAGGFNYNDAFQDVNPSVEVDEAYIDAEQGEFSARIGMQKIFWGKLDRQQPNDLLNPYRYIDPFLEEQSERKIGVPAVLFGYTPENVEWLPDQAQFNLVWEPMYVPFRLPVLGERWFPPAAVTQPVLVIPGGVIPIPGDGFVPQLDVPITETIDNTAPPTRNLANSGLGLRASGYADGVDFAGYYYHGFDIHPALKLLVDALSTPNPMSPLGFDVSAATTLQPVYTQINSLGGDAAYTAGPFTLRGEGAFIFNRAFSRNLSNLETDPALLGPQIVKALQEFMMGVPSVPIDVGPTFVQKDSLDWGIGADYTYEGWFALLQLNQTDVFDNSVRLLINDVETSILTNIRKSWFDDRLRAQLIAVYGVSGYLSVLPRLSYFFTDNVDLQLGYLAIDGSRNTLIGQYKNNSEGFLRLRLAF